MKDFASEKVIGYFLLFAGVVAILFAFFNLYQVFTNKASPVSPFNFGPVAVDLSKFVPDAPAGLNMTQDLIKADMINRPMNLFAHFLLMGFLVTVGSKIATIGAMLVRPIKVKLNSDKSNQTSS